MNKLLLRFHQKLAVVGLLFCMAALVAAPLAAQTTVARGAGTTIIEGGTGSTGLGPYGPFTPVLTTVAFHAERNGRTITGSFNCLARAPEPPGSTGASQSALFDVNVMNVVGQITGAVVHGDKATLTGTATVTGVGAGTNLPFTVTVQKGGAGATVVLKVSGLTFQEILLDGGHIEIEDGER